MQSTGVCSVLPLQNPHTYTGSQPQDNLNTYTHTHTFFEWGIIYAYSIVGMSAISPARKDCSRKLSCSGREMGGGWRLSHVWWRVALFLALQRAPPQPIKTARQRLHPETPPPVKAAALLSPGWRGLGQVGEMPGRSRDTSANQGSSPGLRSPGWRGKWVG